MFFKSFVSRNQSKNGDNIWISVCGNLSVIIDAVSISRNPELTNKFIIEFLNELENDLMQHTSEEIIIKLNDTLVHKNNDLLASVCVLKKINNTIEKINLTLRTYTGGYLRFEQDHYMEGQNPWPIATLWMAMYYNQKGEKEKAEECIKFVVNSCNEHGLLAEQVDNKTMTSNWVIGLGWSHAMFVLSQKEISQK